MGDISKANYLLLKWKEFEETGLPVEKWADFIGGQNGSRLIKKGKETEIFREDPFSDRLRLSQCLNELFFIFCSVAQTNQGKEIEKFIDCLDLAHRILASAAL